MSGIPLWMHTGHVDDDGPLQFRSERYMCGQNPEAYGWEKVIARPKHEDEAREAVVAAARRWRDARGTHRTRCAHGLQDALDRLDALTKGDA